MNQSSSPWLGIVTNLLLSLVLMNWLTCKQEIFLGALVSLAFFTLSTTGLMMYKHHQAQIQGKQKAVIESTEPTQVATLKEQLRNCLQYGDTEKAEEISQKLVALNSTGSNPAADIKQ